MKDIVLWLDNDEGYINPFVVALEKEGLQAIVARSALEAETIAKSAKPALIIVDVMIPTVSDEEEEIYRPELTSSGLKTGLAFYMRMRDWMIQNGIPVLVLSVRVDEEIRDEFLRAGLAEFNFETKMDLRTRPAFVAKINALLKKREG